ncbi:MAG: cytochrome c biogenesis CcdA family protein [Pseudomonadota bacterium]
MLELSGIGLATAFAAGLISFLSPCVLPLVPGYLSYVTGRSLDDLRRPGEWRSHLAAVWLSLFFVFGFSTVFVALGASATAVSQWLLKYRYEANLVGGGIVILFGLLLAGVLRVPGLEREFRFAGPIKGGNLIGAFVLGLAFAFAWTPCIGPVLGAILTVSASSVQVANGVYLLAVYSLGLGLPFLIAAAFTGAFLDRVRSFRRWGRPLQMAAGGVMAIMGIAMITGDLSSFSYWLLKTFPALGLIG